MKKTYLLAAVVAAVGLSSCGGNTSSNVAEEDFLKIEEVATLDEETSEDNVVNELAEKLQSGDAAAVTDAVTKAQTELQRIIETGDAEAVKQYATQVKAFVEENADALKNLNIDTKSITDLISTLEGLPNNVEDAADAAVSAVKNDVEAVKAAAKESAVQAVDDAKAKANEAANKAVVDAQNKVNEAANKAVNDAADKLKNALNKQ